MTASLHTACRGSIAPTLREKMICSILLLITLTSCVSGPLVVNVTQRSYQAEENHNATLEWTFKTRTDGSLKSLNIFCEMFTDLRPFILFHLHEGDEDSESQHERFAGRVQFDKDVLREGRLRLHMSRLRTNDSGLYQCGVTTGDDEGSGNCHLNVTERVRPKPETPNSRSGGRDASTTGSPSQPERRGRIGLYCGLGLIVVVGTLLGGCYCLRRNQQGPMNHSPSTELDPMIHSPPKELDPMNHSPPKELDPMNPSPSIELDPMNPSPPIELDPMNPSPPIELDPMNPSPPIELDPMNPSPSIELDPMNPSPSIELDPMNPSPIELDPMNPSPSIELDPMNPSPSIELDPMNPSPPIELDPMNPSPPIELDPMNPSPSIELDPMNPSPSIELDPMNPSPPIELDPVVLSL
ncbi:uncharacterized protein PEZ65_021835 [Lycodopsis pacificus]